jgi:hypothetical protein
VTRCCREHISLLFFYFDFESSSEYQGIFNTLVFHWPSRSGPPSQDRAKWHRLATKTPFAIGKPFLRQPRGDTRATPEGQRLAIARRSAEIKERWAIFAANANANADTPTNNP